MKKKRVMVIALCVAMLFSMMSVYAFAGETTKKDDSGIVVHTVTDGAIGFVRNKALQGKLSIEADSSGCDLDYIKVTITVQKKSSSGSWSQYQAPYDIYGDAEDGFINTVKYIDVKETGVYRVKAVFSDKRNGTTTTTPAYYSSAASL